MKARYDFSISSFRFLNSDGHVVRPLPDWCKDTGQLLEAYRTMVLLRLFDQKAIALQRTGQLGTYPSLLGHEAISVAMGQALTETDVFVPYYRDQATMYLHGVQLSEILQYWGGDERGSDYKHCPKDLPICVPIATQYGHAAGIASAMRIRQEARATLVSGGDGSTSKGDFLESLNLSGAWQLPLVFVISNNQWAISTPRHLQCKAETLAQKAIGAGITGVVVDGNDYIATYDQIDTALKRARAGKGPTLIEAITYRLGDHTTADDARRYRSNDELDHAWQHEPVSRLQKYLNQQGVWDDEQEATWQSDAKAEISRAVEAYQAITREPPTAMFDHLFATLPGALQDQYDALAAMDAGSNTQGKEVGNEH